MFFLPLLLILLLAFPATSGGQEAAGGSPFVMNFDYARFRNDATSGYLEFYYMFYCGQLKYQLEGPSLRGAIVLNTEVTKETSGEPVVKEHTVLPIVLADTTIASQQQLVVRQAGHYIPMGRYSLHVVAYDSANPSMRDSLRLKLDVNPYTERPALSDLELCSSIKASSDRSDPYYKNAHIVIPNPTLVFGKDHPVVYVYTELYDLDTAKTYRLEYDVVDNAGASVKKVGRDRRYSVASTVEVGTLNAVSLKSGRYSLRLTLKDAVSGKATQVEKRFYVDNPSIALESAPSISPSISGAVAALSPVELDKEFQQIKYLATESEMYLINQLKDEEGKKKFLQDFWNRMEAGSDGRSPVKRADFLQSVSIANDRYSHFGKEGWRTDRGRVFILYGKPDEIERHPSEGEARPFEIWYYYQIENGVQFIFVDRTGFGDYQLVHSTKRGELRDEGWSRYLR